jgi:serine/threonine-protein kinase
VHTVAQSFWVRLTTMALTPGARVGPYEILALLGTGGMGEVWKARDTRLNRIVAVKRLNGRHSQRFEQEARAIAALNHPHICQIYDVGADYLVLEYIEGQTLADRLRTRGGLGLPAEEAVAIARQIAEALEEAHRVGILHRDLKPANVMITTKGATKLLDFGLARLATADADATRTVVGTVLGTPAYMSPEQAEGKPLDARSDIFSFGAVLYEMLSGQRAFEGTTTAQGLNPVLRDKPLRLQTRPVLDRLVRQCLAKQPGSRFQTITEVRSALEQAVREFSSAHRSDELPPYVPSIAVLPFVNMSADKENEYFSDGLAEEIINVLANTPGLKVAGRTSSFFFRGKDVEFEEIGQRLRVDHILEGSVRKSGSRLRVTAQLIKVADGFHLWSERYDREMTDIFALQDEVTQAIAAALQVRLSPEAAVPRRRTPDLRAYDAYLKALDQWSRPTPESLLRAKEHLDRAIALDPDFAPAYTALGLYYSMQASLGNRPTREVIPLARAAVHEALRIDPSLPEPHALLGVWAGGYEEYDWHAAEQHWRCALAREPVSCHVRFWYGNHYLLPLGRFHDAVDAMAKGLEGDPLSLLYRHHFADGLRNAGRLEEAEVELRRILELDGSFAWAVGTLGVLCAQQGKWDEALALSEKAYSLSGLPLVAGQLAALLARTDQTSRADTLLAGLRSGTAWGASAGMAMFHALRGELDQATEWVERAIEDRYPRVVPVFAPFLMSSPKWPALARMMNLPEASLPGGSER